MKHFLSTWQGLWALIATWVLFAITPKIFQFFNLSAGVIDPAYLHALVFTCGVYFTSIFCAWLAVQCDWKVIDKDIDSGKISKDWQALTSLQRVVITFVVIAFLISAFIGCFFALPKP